MTALYAIAAILAIGVGWSVWIYTRGSSGAAAKDDLKEERRANKAEDDFREGLRDSRRTVRSWFWRNRRRM